MKLSIALVRWLVAGLLAGVIGVGLLLSQRSKGPDQPPTTALGTIPTSSSTETPATVDDLEALPSHVAAPLLVGSTLYYHDDEALTMQQFDLAKRTKLDLPTPLLAEASPIGWAANGSRFVAQLSASSPRWSSLETQTGTPSVFDPSVFLPTLNPTGTKLAYQYRNQTKGTMTVTIAEATGGNWISILPVTEPYARLWFGPMETYLVALDDIDPIAHYDRIGISSKTATKLADGNGELKWSPSGQLALLDSGDGQRVTVATIESGALTKISGATMVDRLTWESESTLVGFVGADLARIDLAKRTTTVLTKGAADGRERASVVGLFQQRLLLLDTGVISELTVPKP